MREFETQFYRFLETERPAILEELAKTATLSDELSASLAEAIETFRVEAFGMEARKAAPAKAKAAPQGPRPARARHPPKRQRPTRRPRPRTPTPTLPHHPLAAAEEPISDTELLRHRAVAVADSAQRMTPVTVNLLAGQDVLTVPSTAAKIEAQIRCLGCGHLPEPLAREHIAAGRLVAKQTQRGTDGGQPRLRLARRHPGGRQRPQGTDRSGPALVAGPA